MSRVFGGRDSRSERCGRASSLKEGERPESYGLSLGLNFTERDAVGAQIFHTQSFAMFCCLSLKVDLRDFLNAVSMASKHVIYTASVMDYICLAYH